MWWHEFAEAAPALAARLREEFERAGVVLVGTVRADGSVRISPVEAVFEGGQLYLDMMRSRKALDSETTLREHQHNEHGEAEKHGFGRGRDP